MKVAFDAVVRAVDIYLENYEEGEAHDYGIAWVDKDTTAAEIVAEVDQEWQDDAWFYRNLLIGKQLVEKLAEVRTPKGRRTGQVDNPHEVVHRLFDLFYESGHTHLSLYAASGVHQTALSHWKTRYSPTVTNLDAALRVLGHKLAVVPLEPGEPHTPVAGTGRGPVALGAKAEETDDDQG